MEQTNNFFEVIHKYPYKEPILYNTVCNVQPSQISAQRVFLALAHFRENLQFPKKIPFEYFDLNDSDYIQLCRNFVGNKHCMVRIVIMWDEFLLQLGLDGNLMLNCKDRDLLKFVFIIVAN